MIKRIFGLRIEKYFITCKTFQTRSNISQYQTALRSISGKHVTHSSTTFKMIYIQNKTMEKNEKYCCSVSFWKNHKGYEDCPNLLAIFIIEDP